MNALQGAVEGGRLETVEAIMLHVSTNEELKTAITMNKNEDGKTAWDVAAAAKNEAICNKLKEYGDENAKSGACIVS